MTEHGYADPAALRQAINERLRALVREDSRLQLADLQRQFAYDRFLTRVFLAVDRDRWVLKGAAALLARLHGRTRHTVDVDLYREESGPEEAEAALRDAAARDLGDFFRFTLSPGRPVAQAGAARRVPVVAYLGATEFASFHVDLVTGIAMTGEPDEVPSLVPIELSGLETVRYRIYPIADHVADKVCALLELHPRAAGPSQVSTRYRDLADLAVIAHAEVVAAEDLRVALAGPVSSGHTPDAHNWRLAVRLRKGRAGCPEPGGTRPRSCALDGSRIPRPCVRRHRRRRLGSGDDEVVGQMSEGHFDAASSLRSSARA